MSKNYSIEFKLDAEYSEINIQKILERGLNKGFVYYDDILADIHKKSPALDAKQAAQKVIKAFEEGSDEGPNVYTSFGRDEGAHLWFYKTEDGYLKYSPGAFWGVRKKGYYMDFDYYVRFLLDLCIDFAILEIRADIID